MRDDRALRLFHEIQSKTSEGRMPWEPTADENIFMTPIKDKYVLLIRSYDFLDDRTGEPMGNPSIVFREGPRDLVTINSALEGATAMELRELYANVKRQALRIDAKIDDALGDIEAL